ncbi:MAG: TonB family protein [Rhodobacteraceae bacterium]|nr:TonB family protein [Paracoccaceae bacterium]
MIPKSAPVAVLAMGLSISAHFAIGARTDLPELQIEGSSSDIHGKLGSSFKDLVQGAIAPETIEDETAKSFEEPAVLTARLPKDQSASAATQDLVAKETPTSDLAAKATIKMQTTEMNDATLDPKRVDTVAQSVSSEKAIAAKTSTQLEDTDTLARHAVDPLRHRTSALRAEKTAAQEPTKLQPTEIVEAKMPDVPALAEAPAIQEVTEVAQPKDMFLQTEGALRLKTSRFEVVQRPLLAQQPLKAPKGARLTTDTSKRPKMRQKPDVDPTPKPKVARQTAQPAVKKPRGNASQNAAAGAVDGTLDSQDVSKSNTSAKKLSSSKPGNASASNYKGLVHAKIARAGRPSVRVSKAAVVTFTISASGAVSGISVAQSSGNARFDREARAIVRRAAPFPPRPPGAASRFRVRIGSR